MGGGRPHDTFAFLRLFTLKVTQITEGHGNLLQQSRGSGPELSSAWGRAGTLMVAC